ncbi:glucosaminidase domain-containing protein [Thalassospira alkalitolerans]|uniref:glucosaminidase domain-containing protein n=1 Tax=Thalassospira alkalitolerans TaxID=1293890 RepID=UPI0030ED9042|tara:strand:+ start:252774 stop:253763 length:990 start_codon:yes stop_codon:yes gene_type:complete
MNSAEKGSYRKIALASVFGAVGLLYTGILGGWDISPEPKGMGFDETLAATVAPEKKNVKPLYRRDPEVVALNQYYKSIGYKLASVEEIPRIYIKRVPKGLRDLTSVTERKQIFLRIMLPLALRLNEEIAARRDRLMMIQSKKYSGDLISLPEKEWIDQMMKRYRVTDGSITALLERIDIIPPSLILAQSAEESGWGTSRFVRKGNALFGQWAWDEDDGIVPEDREEGKTHVIKSFDSLIDSIRAYARNINSHPAYAELRAERAKLREGGDVVRGWDLADTLTKYSERGTEYVESLHAIMRVNGLDAFDGMSFADGEMPSPPSVLALLDD